MRLIPPAAPAAADGDDAAAGAGAAGATAAAAGDAAGDAAAGDAGDADDAGGPSYAILYDGEEGFEAEERPVAFLSERELFLGCFFLERERQARQEDRGGLFRPDLLAHMPAIRQ